MQFYSPPHLTPHTPQPTSVLYFSMRLEIYCLPFFSAWLSLNIFNPSLYYLYYPCYIYYSIYLYYPSYIYYSIYLYYCIIVIIFMQGKKR